MTRHGDGECQATGFKRAGRIRAFFFQERTGIAAARKHGSPAFAKRDGARVWEHGTITPHAGPRRLGGIAGDSVACCDSAQRFQIVADVERTFASWAERLGRRGRKGGLATGTFQVFDWWHEVTITDGARAKQDSGLSSRRWRLAIWWDVPGFFWP